MIDRQAQIEKRKRKKKDRKMGSRFHSSAKQGTSKQASTTGVVVERGRRRWDLKVIGRIK